jgi:hypothetical protein
MNEEPVTDDNKLAAGPAPTVTSSLINTVATPWINCCRTLLITVERFALHAQSTPPQPASQRQEAKQFPTPSLQLTGKRKQDPWPEHCNHGRSRLLPGHCFGGIKHCDYGHKETDITFEKQARNITQNNARTRSVLQGCDCTARDSMKALVLTFQTPE